MHLNLEIFKTHLCPLTYTHCRYYHSQKDKRRLPNAEGHYISADLCKYEEVEKCPDKDDCKFSHNRVERLYHIEKYKTRYCTKYPKNIDKCEYREFCSFAHTFRDIKTRVIHFLTKDDDFYMFYFKTEWCPFNNEHNEASCEYAHNWQDFRRKPHLFDYDYT